MSASFDFDRVTQDWLADGPTSISDRALQAALNEVHLTHQRRFGAKWRTLPLNASFVRFAAAAIAVVVVIAAALFMLGRLPAGLVGNQPTPTPAPAPTAQTLSAALTYPLVPGDYVTASPFLVPGIQLALGDRWGVNELKPSRLWMATVTTNGKDVGAHLLFEVPTAVYKDPCTEPTVRFDPSTGPTIDDFVADLRRMAHFTVGPTSTRTLDGVSVTEVDITNDIAPDGTGCTLEQPPFIYPWDSGQTNAGSRQHLVLAEVGGKRLLIDAIYIDPEGSTEDEVNAVIDSIRFP